MKQELGKKTIAGLTLGLAFTVTACGGGGGTQPANTLPPAQAGQNILSDIPDGAVITGRAVSGRETMTTADVSLQQATVEFVDSDNVTVSVNGQTYMLEFDAMTNTYVDPGDPLVTFRLNDDPGLSGQFATVGILEDLSGLEEVMGIVIGFQTDPADLPGGASVTYTGETAFLRSDLGTGALDRDDGTFVLEADFVSEIVQAELTFDSGVQLGMLPTDIIDGSFEGTLVESEADLEISNTTIEGSFYGDAGQEVAGTFGADFIVDDGMTVEQGSVAGVFHGEQ